MGCPGQCDSVGASSKKVTGSILSQGPHMFFNDTLRLAGMTISLLCQVIGPLRGWGCRNRLWLCWVFSNALFSSESVLHLPYSHNIAYKQLDLHIYFGHGQVDKVLILVCRFFSTRLHVSQGQKLCIVISFASIGLISRPFHLGPQCLKKCLSMCYLD